MRIPKIGYSLLISLLLIIAFHVVSGSLPQQEIKKYRIDLHADLYTYDRKIIANAERLIGNVVMSHGNVIMYCDSAYSYKDSNKVDAFGHVHIIQADTLHIYGNKTKYDGNTKIARVKGNVKMVNKSIVLTTDELIYDMKANVGYYDTGGKIVDTANVLVSKIGRYYSREDLCFFKDSVKVTNKDFVLRADTLKYNTKTERAFIVGPTHIVGTTKEGTLYSERGWYDTRTNIAELYKASKIMGKEQSLQGDTIFYARKTGFGKARSKVLLSDTTNHVIITGRTGVYNEKTKIAFVTDSAIFMQYTSKDTLFMHADTLKSVPDVSKNEVAEKIVNKAIVPKSSGSKKNDPGKLTAGKLDTAIRKLNILNDSTLAKIDSAKISDTAAKLLEKIAETKTDTINQVKTDTVNVNQKIPVPVEKLALALKDSAWALKDTVKLKPDTLVSLLVKPSKKDTAAVVADTSKNENKLFMAYHRVRFYKKDLQGLCDSLSYQMKDSLMRLFKDPVLWSDVHQMTAEKIEYRPHKPDPSIARLDNNGFIISREDSIKFNQISGKTLVGYIYKNELKNIEVNGNAVTLYYIKNKDQYSGMNKLESSKISVTMVNSKIDNIDFFPSPEGKSIPLKDLTPEDSKLKGFEWREGEKPRNRFDLYPVDEKRKKNAGSEKKPATKKLKENSF
jgi:lipopolysaccharide export system protein LptA